MRAYQVWLQPGYRDSDEIHIGCAYTDASEKTHTISFCLDDSHRLPPEARDLPPELLDILEELLRIKDKQHCTGITLMVSETTLTTS